MPEYDSLQNCFDIYIKLSKIPNLFFTDINFGMGLTVLACPKNKTRIANKLLQFVHGIKVNCNAPIELKQTLDSLTPIADQEIPSKNTYELKGLKTI